MPEHKRYRVLNADGHWVAAYDDRDHAIEAARDFAAACAESDPSSFYTVHAGANYAEDLAVFAAKDFAIDPNA